MPAIAPVSSTAIEGSHVFKVAGGTLYSISVVIGATSGWLMVFNAISDPADGPVTPLLFWPVTSDGASGYFFENFATPASMTAGIVAVFSSTGPLTKTESATALFTAQFS